MLLSSFLFKAYDYLIFRAAYQYTERVNIHSCFGSIVLSCKPPCHTGNSSSNIQTTSNKWKPNHPANNPSKKVNTASTYILHYRRISSIQQIKCNVINANEISQKMLKYWLKREITVLDVLLRLNSFQRSTISSINSTIHLLIRNGLLTRNCNFLRDWRSMNYVISGMGLEIGRKSLIISVQKAENRWSFTTPCTSLTSLTSYQYQSSYAQTVDVISHRDSTGKIIQKGLDE